MKYCNICNTDKSESCFGKRAASKDGLATICKTCQREYDQKRNRSPNRIRHRKRYSMSEAGKAAGNKAKRKWLEKNTVKRAAHILIGNAIQSGKIKKPVSCEKCACCDTLHGHHDDYAEPLKVRWLCGVCHSKWHDENGEGLNAN